MKYDVSPNYSFRSRQNNCRFLIYLEMANNHRCGIMASLGRTLMYAGHTVAVACEPEIAIQFGDNSDIHVENNRRRIQKAFTPEHFNEVLLVDVYCGDTPAGINKANVLRRQHLLKIIAESKPDYVILWSGNFHYQKGTLAALRDSNMIGRTLFTEVGWFSQKEHVYLDTKGVNSFSTLSRASVIFHPRGQSYFPLQDFSGDRFTVLATGF